MHLSARKTKTAQEWRHHIERNNWLSTPEGDARGYIQPHALDELWFHTGTRCNLGCWFCLEGSGPKADRLDFITFDEAKTFIDEALTQGVKRFSFTGGEPFVNPDMIPILKYALDHRPCLILTNGTKPLIQNINDIRKLHDKPNDLKFRVSLDYPDPERHDDARGKGSFTAALRSSGELHKIGFSVSIARHRDELENVSEVDKKYLPFFESVGLPFDTPIISFPELHKPGAQVEIPHITENCMTTHKDVESRSLFMCAFSKMIVKTSGKIGLYACTLVDDDPDYDLGGSLTESMNVRVMLKHHRCYSCFASGTSCSE